MPTVYWVNLKLPLLRPVIEFLTLLPIVVLMVVLVSALIRTYNRTPLTDSRAGTNVPADRRVRDAIVPLHVPRDRHGPALDQRADRGGSEPGGQLGHHPIQGDLSNIYISLR
ncbi:MAG: hypothetical protein U0Z44_05690 [Kouleothrix sp.]